jgi:hypothetical protein
MSEDNRVFAVLEKLEVSVDRLLTRVEALETRAASSGKISPGAMLGGVVAVAGLVIALVAPVSGLVWLAVENRTLIVENTRAREEKEMVERVSRMETLLRIAMREEP